MSVAYTDYLLKRGETGRERFEFPGAPAVNSGAPVVDPDKDPLFF